MVGLARISSKVGRGATNRAVDVKIVQALLNKFSKRTGLAKLKEDGLFGSKTEAAIEAYQRKVMKISPVLKVIAPGSLQHRALMVGLPPGGARPQNFDPNDLSGLCWFDRNQKKYSTSTSERDLESGFRTKVEAFLKALKAAGARVTISTTRRPKARAQVMHYAYRVAKRELDPSKVPVIPDVKIVWDHGNKDRSVYGAREMVKAFNIADRPSLTSHHITGKAIDMTISWSGDLSIIDGKGKTVIIKTGPRNGNNTELHKVGTSYGVKKLVRDKPHWSFDGK
jgi:hypothetical protein